MSNPTQPNPITKKERKLLYIRDYNRTAKMLTTNDPYLPALEKDLAIMSKWAGKWVTENGFAYEFGIVKNNALMLLAFCVAKNNAVFAEICYKLVQNQATMGFTVDDFHLMEVLLWKGKGKNEKKQKITETYINPPKGQSLEGQSLDIE